MISSTSTIPFGDDGALATVEKMRQLANDATGNPNVVAFARELIYNPVPRPQPQAFAARVISAWLKGVWRYVDDPINRELLVTPDAMLRQYEAEGIVTGDCDEAAILGAALGMSVGIPAVYTVVGFDDGTGQLSHVFTSLLPNGGPRITLDVTRPLPGSPVPRVVQAIDISV